MTMTKREKVLIIIVLVLAVLCVYYIYLLQPKIKELDELSAQNASKLQTVSTNEQIKSSIGSIDKRIADTETKINQISECIMTKFDQPAVLYYLNDTISEYADKVMFTFEGITETGQINICRVKATMVGTYEGMKKVLASLSEDEYFIRVVELDAKWSIIDDLAASSGAIAPGQTVESSEQPITPAEINNTLDITMMLEFYNIGNEIPPDKSYPFSDGYTYGGDIFF